MALLVTYLMAQASGLALEDFRHRTGGRYPALDEYASCAGALVATGRAIRPERIDRLVARVDDYVRRWRSSADLIEFVESTSGESARLAHQVLVFQLNDQLGESALARLQKAESDLTLILTYDGFVARDIELFRFEEDLLERLDEAETSEDPPLLNEIEQITDDMVLLREQGLASRLARKSNYEMPDDLPARVIKMRERAREYQ